MGLPLHVASPSPTAAAAASTSLMSSSNALELMRTYHMYVRMHKTRCRYLLLLLLMFLYYFQCTLCGPYDLLMSGAAGGSSLAGVGAGDPSKDGGLRLGLAAPDAGTAGDGGRLAGSSEGRRHRYARPPLITRALSGIGATVGRMDLWEVQWWPPSNRTPDAADAHYEQGLHVATPSAASLSLARSEPPWSVDTQRGLVAAIARSATRLSGLLFGQDPPPYELALSAFFRTRQATSGRSCNPGQAGAIDNDVRKELIHYSAFARDFKLRVPLLLYYNRMPVYAMMQHLRLMRVRNCQLLDYMSRAHASRHRPEKATGDVADNPDLHARQLSFELARLSLVLYLQRLHLRALRHADAMRLETFHFLRHLSSTIPVLRSVWVGQDHCSWPGVSCVVVRVPLNSLIDSEHPAVQAFVEDIFSVCRGPQCRQRRCAAPSCSAYTRHLTRRLFTSAAPAYWLKWDRTDDTAAMDEMIWEKTPTSSRGAAGVNAMAAAQPPSPSAASTGSDGDAGRSGSRKAATASSAGARSSHGTPARSKRSVWTEQMFAYEHPHLVLTEPTLLVDIDVQNIIKEIVEPILPSAPCNSGGGECVSSSPSLSATLLGPLSDFATPEYAEDVERPLTGDLFGMQRRLLRTIAEAAPRGLQYGKQRNGSSTVTIPYTFVKLNLANMGLRGYLPGFYDIASAYDDQRDTAAAHGKRETTNTGSGGASGTQSGLADACEAANLPSATPAATRQRGSKSAPKVSVLTPRSDLYWGRRSRMRMLEARNLSSASLATAAARRSLSSVAAIRSELQWVLRRLEKIGQRNHHEDLAAYFSEVASLARFQSERWSPYRWPEAMITATSNVSQSATRRLYTILENSAFSPSFADPVQSIDHSVNVFGELNPRLIGLLSLDVSANPLLTHVFPRTWLSIPHLQSVRTTGTSILAPPLRLRSRLYSHAAYCPASSVRFDSGMKADTEEAMGERPRRDTEVGAPTETARDEVEVSSATESSLHDKDFISAVLIPPFSKIDTVFSARNPSETVFQHQDPPLTGRRPLKYPASLHEGFLQGIKRLLSLQ
ncbi:conserved hypothetical protein [Leishmania mexicana MHOM/GT/2001/U1103]|uniref:Uncharacterized protein n=1 Tax=Leishmania mexicana (strain MHOM/GT/2001/U1103) TaxID=929439 RepID=E9AKJ7_LEIMU|nr:conserved hypothetical protein [Leishmania mexicana MHOM/GT/2001/U1103]CBZ23448.1 conserved hypothetical protein [Leishmania mexicana MHOM/GT/2001/U1103]